MLTLIYLEHEIKPKADSTAFGAFKAMREDIMAINLQLRILGTFL